LSHVKIELRRCSRVVDNRLIATGGTAGGGLAVFVVKKFLLKPTEIQETDEIGKRKSDNRELAQCDPEGI